MLATVENASPPFWEPELHMSSSRSEGKERSFAPMRVSKARRARETRKTPNMRVTRARERAIRTPEDTTPRPLDSEVTEVADDAPTTFSSEPVPWLGYRRRLQESTGVTPIVEKEGPKVIFMSGSRSSLSPLILKRMRIDKKNDDPDYGKLPMEFVIGPLPGPPAPKLLVGTSRGKRACRRGAGRVVAPYTKWAPPLHFPSTSTPPIRTISTEWDSEDDDEHKSPPFELITPPPA